jgi:hypothetical protein
MTKKFFEVKVYYSGFCTFEISAKSKDEAISLARRLPRKDDELIKNLENWQDADEAFELIDEKRKN